MRKEEQELEFCQAMFVHYKARIAGLEKEIKRLGARKAVTPEDDEKLETEFGYCDSTETGEVRISRPFDGEPNWLRYMTLRLDTDHSDEVMEVFGFEAADVHVVKRSPRGQIEVKALVYDDKEGIQALTIQRWDHRRTPPAKEAISVSGHDLTRFMTFLVSTFYVRFSSDKGMRRMLTQLGESLEAMALEYEASPAGQFEARRSAHMERWGDFEF